LRVGSETAGCGGGAGWISAVGFVTGVGRGGGGGALGFGDAGAAEELCMGGDTVEDPAMSRLVVRATDTVMGGGTTGAAGVIVTWAVGVVGGTNVICGGRTGAGAGIGAGLGAGACAGAGAGASAGGIGFMPCSSSFLSSSVAMSVLMK
jgi:hypothetical protein